MLLFLFAFAIHLHADNNKKRRILILNFENLSRNPDYEYLKSSLADSLKLELLKTGKFSVLDQDIFHIVRPGVSVDGLTVEDITAFAEEMNCENAVIGNFTARNDKIEISIRVVDSVTREEISAARADGLISSSLFQTIDEAVLPLSQQMTRKLTGLEPGGFWRDETLEDKLLKIESGKAREKYLAQLAFERAENLRKEQLASAERAKREAALDAASARGVITSKTFIYIIAYSSLPTPPMTNFVSPGFGGKVGFSHRLHRLLYPYFQASFSRTPGKLDITSFSSLGFHSGFYHPFIVLRVLRVAPYIAGGMQTGWLIDKATNTYLLPSLDGGLYFDISLTRNINLSLAFSYSYMPDPKVAMGFGQAGLGVGWHW